MQNPLRHSLAALALLATVVTGCGDDNSTPITPTPSARVMVVHASPDAPTVDLLVDGSVVGPNLSFPNNTGYLTVAAGTRNVKVNLAGTTTTVLTADVPVVAGLNYSVFASGAVANISTVVLVDNLTAPAAGKAHVRFVHLSPDAPAVDVAVAGGVVLFPNIAFKGSTAFTPVDAGTYDLEVRQAGTSTVVLSFPGITLQAGKIYTVFARGFVSGSGAQALGAQIIVNS